MVQGWHKARLSEDDSTILQIGVNIINTIDSYPATATERTSLIQSTSIGKKSLFFFLTLTLQGIPNTRYARVIGRSARAIYSAKNAEGMTHSFAIRHVLIVW